MSNRVYVKVKEERELDSKLNPIMESSDKNVYIGCDGVICAIGTIANEKELIELISPRNIMNVINENLSCDELDILMPVFKHRKGKYFFHGKEMQAIL